MIRYQPAGRGRKVFHGLLAGLVSVSLLSGIGITQVHAAEAAEPAELQSTAAANANVSGYVTVGDFEVTARSGTVRITEYTGDGGEITLPQNVKIQGETVTVTGIAASRDVFQENKKITKVNIPDGYTSIEGSSFQNCTALTEVNIPGSVTAVSYSAFEGCTSLSSVRFDEATTAEALSVGMNAFKDCALTSVTLPARLSELHGSSFCGNDSLTSIEIDSGSSSFTQKDGAVYQTDEETASLIAYAPGRQTAELSVPETVAGKQVTVIGLSAFRYHPYLQKITLPASVTEIQSYAFNGMTAIREIVLQSTTPPALNSDVCTDMAEGSKIIVPNQEVADAFAVDNPESLWPTEYYTEGRTTVEIAGTSGKPQEPENPEQVSASLSLSAHSGPANGNAVYDIYLDSAENVTTVLLKLSFDGGKTDKGTLTSALKDFNITQSGWSEESGRLTLTAYLGKTGDEPGYTSQEKTLLASVSVPVKDGASGSITATLEKAACAGIITTEESALDGTVTVTSPSEVSVILENCDVNGDGTVTIVDIAEAQRYYRMTENDDSWDTVKHCDVNGDGTIDVQDYIDIFLKIADF